MKIHYRTNNKHPVIKEYFLFVSNPTVLILYSDGEEADRLLGYDKNPDKYRKKLEDIINCVNYIGSFEKKYYERPDDPMRAYNLAMEYYNRLRWKEAIPFFEKVINNEKSKTMKIKTSKRSLETSIYKRASYLNRQIKGIVRDR